MSKTLQKIAPKWHEEAKQMLLENFERVHSLFTDATKRAVWMGLFLSHIKQRGKEDKSIPHGQFREWLKANVPNLSFDTVATYMRLATGVAEKGKFQISDFPTFAGNGKLPPQLEKLVEGKTQQQLFLEFKQVDEEGNARRGQLKGSQGLTKAMRALAKEKSEAKKRELRLECTHDSTAWLLETADASGLEGLSDKQLIAHRDACVTKAGAINRLLQGRKGGAV
jgi:hypothetical protein